MSAADPFSVEIDAPDDLSTNGNQTIAVTVTNNNDTTLPSPIVEVPISSPVALPDGAEDAVYVNDTTDLRDADVRGSTISTGDALFITGEEVPPRESRTYHFNVTVSSAGTTSLTADVRSMYNEQNNNVRTTEQLVVSGVGTVNASVIDNDENAVSGAAVVIDGLNQAASVSERVLEGDHTVSASLPNAPEFTVGVGISETASVTFVDGDNSIQPVAYVGEEPTPVGNSTSESDGNAETPVNTTVSVTISKTDGTVVYDIAPPVDKPLRGNGVATTDANLVDQTTVDGETRVRLNETDVGTQVTVEFEGYELGNADLDDNVDEDDASTIAQAASSGSDAAYGDVNGDGQVNGIDAMLVQQYSENNRDADYTIGGA
ncbi:dockerin type I domain-containing protein [Haloferax sp. Atlit-6N]|uniref:dockerin type I domain-containing protein n=1 Tax=Haloferax sp. Atlit-6N TaxID=2077205 RepID=UPI001F3CE47A|nr:dockerin type I domain-containing protein [Haloferax sp. Atlit-6N]